MTENWIKSEKKNKDNLILNIKQGYLIIFKNIPK
jgi:hypothetical protein